MTTKPEQFHSSVLALQSAMEAINIGCDDFTYQDFAQVELLVNRLIEMIG